jgi:hypothetical protein
MPVSCSWCAAHCLDPPVSCASQPDPVGLPAQRAERAVVDQIDEELRELDPPVRASPQGLLGRLRGSHADREQAAEVLKAAFVQGRLAKDEFDLRVGHWSAGR